MNAFFRPIAAAAVAILLATGWVWGQTPDPNAELVIAHGVIEGETANGQPVPATLRNLLPILRRHYPDANITLVGVENVTLTDLTLEWNGAAPGRGVRPPPLDGVMVALSAAASHKIRVSRGDVTAADEALQATFVRVARRIRRFDCEEAFWNWLRTIARNVARDGGRKHRRYLALLHRFSSGRLEREETASHRQEIWRDALVEALAEMDPADSDLVRRKYLTGASVTEISAETGQTEKAVESRLHRARRALADRIRQKLNER
jgi:RNA polymerase sigma factor (sigma-70 family)